MTSYAWYVLVVSALTLVSVFAFVAGMYHARKLHRLYDKPRRKLDTDQPRRAIK